MQASEMVRIDWSNNRVMKPKEQTTLSRNWKGFKVQVQIGIVTKQGDDWTVTMKVQFRDEKTEKVVSKKIHIRTGEEGRIGVFPTEEERGLRHFNLLNMAPIEKEKITDNDTFLRMRVANNGVIVSSSP